MRKPTIPFLAVDFPRVHPQQSVAEHEILMAFNGDDDAAAFYEWWHDKGAGLFGRWLAKERKAE